MKQPINAYGQRPVYQTERSPNPSTLIGGTLAVKQINKIRVYYSLFEINRAFQVITCHLQNLAQTGLMNAGKMGMFAGFSCELESQISHDIVDRMHGIEDEEMYRWEKVRIEREKYLDPDRPR